MNNFRLYLAHQFIGMKQIFFVLCVLTGILFLQSCSKEYTCSCTTSASTEKSFELKLEKMRKNDAKTVCTDYGRFLDTTSSLNYSCGIK
jgi:hypothetical protein